MAIKPRAGRARADPSAEPARAHPDWRPQKPGGSSGACLRLADRRVGHRFLGALPHIDSPLESFERRPDLERRDAVLASKLPDGGAQLALRDAGVDERWADVGKRERDPAPEA